MRRFYFIFLSLIGLLFSSCGDGDIIDVETVTLDFESDVFETCGNLVLYKIEDEPARTLSISLNGLSLDDFTDFGNTTLSNVIDTLTIEREINGGTNRFNFRTYDGNITNIDLFCANIPPLITILTDDESMSGDVIITTEVIEEDNDGIPWQDEDDNSDGDNNPATNPVDTDGDGLPNYLDNDDDGDNVLTQDESLNDDGDDNPFTNSRDSDGDGTPDYLDNDDDNDGVLTRDEESLNPNLNPIDDRTNPDISDYLNPNVSVEVPATAFREHTIIRDFTTTIEVQNFVLEVLTQTSLIFGTSTSNLTLTTTPEFN